jgi:CBS domain-containing protein
MSLDVIQEHMSEIMKTKIDSLIKKPTLIDPSMEASQVISKLSNADVFDAYYHEKNATWNINMRDLLHSNNITQMRVNSLSHAIQSLSEGDTIENAVTIIAHNRTRSAPVVKDNEVIGVLEAQSVLKLISELDNKWIKANQIFTPNPIVIDRQTPLSTARRIMVNRRIDHLPVINKDIVSQVLTSYHVLQAILPRERVGRRDIGSKKIRSLESVVGNLGTNRMANCLPHDDLNTILSSMLHFNTTFCLVSLGNSLQGIITYRDILNLLAKKQKSTIPLFIVGLPREDNVPIITSKFNKVLDRISKVYPDIQEARVYVKKLHGATGRYNYEVSTVILTPIKRYIFTRTGFDLSKVFDEISHRLLRNLSKRAKRRYKLSIRKMM